MVPIKKPLRLRVRLALMARQNLPEAIWSQAVAATFSGETSSPDWLQPICEASHHRATALIGNTQPR